MEDVIHIHKIDSSENVYCHKMGDIVKFDGPFVAKECWACPLWAGLDDGTAVVCVYDDPNAAQKMLTYTKPSAAKAEAPEKPKNPDEVSSLDSLAAMKSRLKLTAADGRIPTTAGGPEPTAPAEEENESVAEEVIEASSKKSEKSFGRILLTQIKKSLPK